MKSRHARLDRFLAKALTCSIREARQLVRQGRVEVGLATADDPSQVIGQFTRIIAAGRVLQDRQAHYVMLHKPAGVVSATRDKTHPTLIGLLNLPYADKLHIAGRLDFNSTGLVLLSNDGHWTRGLSEPDANIFKTYQVELEAAITNEYVDAFARGIYFPFEDITTRPAKLRIISPHRAEVQLMEGRYHQIKRMFGHFNNRVLALHRSAIGPVALDPSLAPGQSRELYEEELNQLRNATGDKQQGA